MLVTDAICCSLTHLFFAVNEYNLQRKVLVTQPLQQSPSRFQNITILSLFIFILKSGMLPESKSTWKQRRTSFFSSYLTASFACVCRTAEVSFPDRIGHGFCGRHDPAQVRSRRGAHACGALAAKPGGFIPEPGRRTGGRLALWSFTNQQDSAWGQWDLQVPGEKPSQFKDRE